MGGVAVEPIPAALIPERLFQFLLASAHGFLQLLESVQATSWLDVKASVLSLYRIARNKAGKSLGSCTCFRCFSRTGATLEGFKYDQVQHKKIYNLHEFDLTRP